MTKSPEDPEVERDGEFFEGEVNVEFENELKASSFYRALKADFPGELKDPSVKLELVRDRIRIEFTSSSYAKMRGVLSTLLRLIRVLEELSSL